MSSEQEELRTCSTPPCPPISPCLDLHLYHCQYLIHYHYQVLMEKDTENRDLCGTKSSYEVPSTPLRPRRKGRIQPDCAHAQVAGGVPHPPPATHPAACNRGCA